MVPPGEAGWSADPFAGEVRDGVLLGRGACDMKGAIAAFVAAAAAHLRRAAQGSISLLITGDEEGPATDGTVRVLEWMAANGHIPDLCLVGEPTNPAALGEVIKIGRRGSLNADDPGARHPGPRRLPGQGRQPGAPAGAARSRR